jgi:hypothetical protein
MKLRKIMRLFLFALCLASSLANAEPLKTLVILPFELQDDQHELSPATVEYQRLEAVRDQMAREIESRHLYRVLDAAPASDLIRRYRAEQPMNECNGCEAEIARALHADRVMVGWVQKVSNLILNLNVRIEDAATAQTLLVKSVDMRGNTDLSWSRSVSYLVNDLADRHLGNR